VPDHGYYIAPPGGVIVSPGGWCTPVDQLPELFTFPPVPRGGIKYPKKEALMPNLTSQLRTLKNKQDNLAAEIADLERKIKASRPGPPPSNQYAWSIDVRFTRDGKLYNYLILRHAGMYYTTGTGADKRFMTWDAFLDWLGTLDGHSVMAPLRVDYEQKSPLESRNR
jgi:hypothetical protein